MNRQLVTLFVTLVLVVAAAPIGAAVATNGTNSPDATTAPPAASAVLQVENATNTTETGNTSTTTNTTTLTILSYNDIQTAAARTDNLPRLVYMINQRRAAHDNPVVVMGAGDEISPHALSPLFEWRPPVDVLNLIDPAVDTIGNHDLDYGIEAFENVSNTSNFTWVATNLINQTTGEPIDGAQRYAVIERGGVRIGVLGAVYQGVDDSVAADLAARNITAKPIVPTLEKYERILREQENVDVVVALVHAGVPTAKRVAKATTIDVALAGHDEIAYPPQVVDGTIISEAKARAEYLSEINLTISNGQVIAAEGRLINITDATPKNQTAVEIIQSYRNRAQLDEVIAHTKIPLNATFAANYHRETGYGNLITDAMRAEVNADVAITNAGGIRSNEVYTGNITGGEVLSTLPFANTVVSVRLTGAELRQVLASQIIELQGSSYGEEISQQVSGVRFEWIPHEGVEQQIRDVYVNGEPLDPNATYEVAVNSYMAGGGSGYPLADEPIVQRTNKVLAQVVIDYMDQKPNEVDTISPVPVGRMQRVDADLGDERIAIDGEGTETLRFAAPTGFSGIADGSIFGHSEESFVMTAPNEPAVAAESARYDTGNNSLVARFNDSALLTLIDGAERAELDLYGKYNSSRYDFVYFESARLSVDVTAINATDGEEPPTESANVTLAVRFGEDRQATVAPGESVTAELVLSEVPEGLSGYDLTVRLTNSAVADITDVTFPEVFGLTEIPTSGPNAVRLRAADIDTNIQPGAKNVTLATITLEAETVGDTGRTNVTIEINRLDDDNGNAITPTVLDGQLMVRTVPPVVNGQPPTDPDGDGLYEDIDGDGELTYNDVVVLFQHLSDPAVRNNAGLYDFNGNDRLGFDDVVEIFGEVGTSSSPQASSPSSTGEHFTVSV